MATRVTRNVESAKPQGIGQVYSRGGAALLLFGAKGKTRDRNILQLLVVSTVLGTFGEHSLIWTIAAVCMCLKRWLGVHGQSRSTQSMCNMICVAWTPFLKLMKHH